MADKVRVPVMVIVPRYREHLSADDMQIIWREGTVEEFVQVVRPLVYAGEMILMQQELQKSAPEAVAAAPDAGESIDPGFACDCTTEWSENQ